MFAGESPVCASLLSKARFRLRMGELIYLDERRAALVETGSNPRPAFYFDLSCPLSYLAAEQVERTLGDVDWIPVSAGTVRGALSDRELEAVRNRAEAKARSLRLPLVWPDRFPCDSPRALRAAAYAVELGAAAPFALAASRLAFCGGFDLDDPEALAESAAAAGVPLDDCLHAAGDERRDARLASTADLLGRHGVCDLPAICVGHRWVSGESALPAAAAMLRRPAMLAPVG